MVDLKTQGHDRSFFGGNERSELGRNLGYTAAIAGLIGTVLSVFAGVPAIAGVTLFITISSVIAIMAIKLGARSLGRLMLVISGAIAFGALHVLTPDISRIPFLLLVSLGSAFVLFSYKNEKSMIIASLLVIALVWAGVMAFAMLGLTTVVSLTPAQADILALGGGVVVLVYLGAQHFFYARIVDNAGSVLVEERNSAIRANVSKSDFVSKMSHEIRTSLNAMLGSLQIMEKTQLTSDQIRMMRTVNRSSESLLRIVDDIMDSFNIISGKLELSPVHVDLLSEVESAVEMLRLMANDQHVEFKLYYDPDLPDVVLADPNRLRQIITNIVGNGINFSGARYSTGNSDGRVELRLLRAGSDHMKIIVTDNGIGMTKDQINKLFKTEKQSILSHKGVGISVSRHLVDLMSGEISVESQEGQGTTLTITLPLDARKQRIDRVDLEGMVVLALVEDGGFSKRLGSYLESRGADYEQFYEVSNVLARLSQASKNTIVLLANEDDDAYFAEIKEIRASVPEAKTLRILNKRYEGLERVSKSEFVLSAAPLMPTELWYAVAELTEMKTSDQPIEIALKPDSGLAEAAPASGNMPTVLIAEDNLINQQVLSQMLAVMGFNVEVAENGAVGLDKWQNGQFDFILADCQMPKMDGYEMTAQIRRFEKSVERTPVKIIGVTANASADAQDRCLKSGMDAFIAKPVAMKELEKLLKKAA